jgi:hypothetical protein
MIISAAEVIESRLFMLVRLFSGENPAAGLFGISPGLSKSGAEEPRG